MCLLPADGTETNGTTINGTLGWVACSETESNATAINGTIGWMAFNETKTNETVFGVANAASDSLLTQNQTNTTSRPTEDQSDSTSAQTGATSATNDPMAISRKGAGFLEYINIWG